MIGIYAIENIKNSKQYIGSTLNFGKRWSYHKWQLKSNRHPNIYLQNAWNLDKEGSFEFKILEEVHNPKLLIETEQKWFNAIPKQLKYNIGDVASNPMSGRHHTQKAKTIISATHKGKSISKKHKEKISRIMKGRFGKKNPAYGKPAWNRGIQMSNETRKKLSLSHVGLQAGNKHPMWGKKHTVTTKIRMSKNHANVNGKNNPMYKKLPWNKGQTNAYSTSAKQKMSEARCQWWANRGKQ